MRINRPGPRDRHFGGLWANSGLETYEFYLADCSKPCDGGDGDGDDDDRSLQKQDWANAITRRMAARIFFMRRM
jgi:hypothetical protein